MTLEFDNLYKITVLALKLNRSHPSTPRNRKLIIQLAISQSLFTVGLLLMLYSVMVGIRTNDFSAICRCGCTSTVYFVNTLQYFTLLYYRNVITKLISNVQSDFDKARSLPEDEDIVARYATQGTSVCKQWAVITFLGVIIFPVTNLILYLKNVYQKKDFELIPLLEMSYPHFVEERKNNIMVYISLYLLMFYFALNSAITYTSFVPLGPIFMIHASGQMELIIKRINKLFDQSLNIDIDEEFRHIVRHLQYVYSFVDDVNECFHFFYEFVLKSDAIIIPVTLYEVIESVKHGEFSIEFIAFIVGGIMISITPAHYSDLLMEKGEELRQAVYACGWERRHDPKALRARKTIIIILTRAVRPVVIRPTFRTLCRDALTDLFQQSYAIFNLMNAMWE